MEYSLMSAFTDLAIKYGAWSLSKANTALQCPHKFYLTYINKPTEGESKYESTEAIIGKRVHKVLELFFAGFDLSKAFHYAIQEGKLTTAERNSVLSYRPAITLFIHKWEQYSTRVQGGPPQTELKLCINKEFKPCSFFSTDAFFRGVIDLKVPLINKPTCVIIDHKTGKKKPISEHGLQLRSYALLLKLHDDKLERVQSGIHYVTDGSIDLCTNLHYVTDISEYVEELITHINKAAANLVDLQVTRPNRLCDWCDQKYRCTTIMGRNEKTDKNRQTNSGSK
jgi:CRISPR/Cas system-associated exonuclease Cas4 (RecB family)